MYINQKADVAAPIVNPGGEIVYELIGNSPASGSAHGHSLAMIVIPPGLGSVSHFHKEEEETYYILAGGAKMIINHKELLLNPGQACLITPLERHQIINIGDGPLEFLAICSPAWVLNDTYFD